MYIGAAEKDRLALAGAPGDTPEQYGQMLPYAAALGMAEAWTKRFAPVPGLADSLADSLADDRPGESWVGSSGEALSAGDGYEAVLEAAAAIAATYGASQRAGGDGFGFDGGSSSSGDSSSGGSSSGGGGGGW